MNNMKVGYYFANKPKTTILDYGSLKREGAYNLLKRTQNIEANINEDILEIIKEGYENDHILKYELSFYDIQEYLDIDCMGATVLFLPYVKLVFETNKKFNLFKLRYPEFASNLTFEKIKSYESLKVDIEGFFN